MNLAPRRLGKSPLEVTPLGFGGGPIGAATVTNAASESAVCTAWELGVRFYDTAPWYGLGRSERRLGLALESCGPREAFRLNTKIGKTLEPEAEREEANRTLSPGGQVRTPRDPSTGMRVHFDYTEGAVLAQHRDSLQRLGMSRVDGITIHDIDFGYHEPSQIDVHLRELRRDGGGGARALEDLRNAGHIQAIGCGCNLEARNAFSWEDGAHEDLVERILDLVDLDFLIVAGPYTLLETRGLRRILPLCEERNLGVVLASPLAGGWLADESVETYMYEGGVPERIVERTRAIRSIAREHDVSVPAAALQFVLAHPAVTTVIPGAKSAAEVEENGRLLEEEIPAEFWQALKAEGHLDDAAPTPG